MRKVLMGMLLCGGLLFAASCSENDTPKVGNENVPQAVLDAFRSEYGDIDGVTWSMQDNYLVANLPDGAKDGLEAVWYTADGGWGIKESETTFAALPEAVRTAFEQGTYMDGSWTKEDDVDILERNQAENLYVITVKKADGTKVKLYYTIDGILARQDFVTDEKGEGYQEYFPESPVASINSWLNTEYPGARIVDIDVEHGGTEVEIISADRMKHEILFDTNSSWLLTKTEYGRQNVPSVVTQAVAREYGADVRIDDVEMYETAEQKYYSVEVEEGRKEHKLYLDMEGNVISRPETPGINGGGMSDNNEIGAFIQQKYSGAVVRDMDMDDGLLEVEIHHQGYEKDVYFTHRGEWVYTKWEPARKDYPESVKNAISNKFHGARIDDMEVIETLEQTYYEVELEGGRYDDWDVIVNSDGKIVRED